MLDEALGDEFQSTEELASLPNKTVDALRSPGELEAQHHELLERQGSGLAMNELADAARDFVRRAQPLGASLEEPRSRHHCQSILDYWSIFVYRNLQIEIDSELLPYDPSLSPTLDDSQFPYRFTEETDTAAQKMLGWRRLLDECERDLAGDHLLTVMGETDAGAHFLIHNLLVPRLRSGQARLPDLSGSEQWRYYEVPLSSDPVTDLLQAIASQDGHGREWVARQKKEFAHDQTTLRRILEAGSELPAVLVFSRFRAVLECSESDHEAFVNNMDDLLQSPQRRFYAIVTLSRDRSMPLSSFGPLEKPLRDGHVRLAFTMAELRHLVEEPARRVGLIFEPGLVDQILINIQGEPAALPLLRFTLERLWKLRERNRITWQAFDKTGAGRTALCKVMEEVHDELSEKQREILRQILLNMVRLEPSGSFTPSEISQRDLNRICHSTAQVKEVLKKLRRNALIHEVPVEGSASYTLTHSALLISWPPLIDWLDDFRDNERLRLRLRDAADQWKSGGKHKDLLWQGKMLTAANEKFGTGSSLTTTEQEFLQASQARAAHKKRMQWTLGIAVVAAIALAVGVAIGVRAFERQLAENAKQRQQMLAEATEHLTKGDLATALLWLDHRDNARSWQEGLNEVFRTSSAEKNDDERVEMIRKLAGSQLPRIQAMAFPSNPGDYVQEYAFKPVAVSPDYEYVAAIHRRKPQAKEGSQAKQAAVVNQVSISRKTSQPQRETRSFCLSIRSLRSLARSGDAQTASTLQNDGYWGDIELDFSTPSATDAHARADSQNDGAVAFINLGPQPGVPELYLLASAGGLHAWKVPPPSTSQKLQAQDWQTCRTQGLEEKNVDYIVASRQDVVAGGQEWVLTIRDKADRGHLQLWKVIESSDRNGLEFTPAPLPDGLASEKVRVAHLSAHGTLLAICENQGDSELKLWTSTQLGDDREWTPVRPPAWVTGLEKSDPQRLYDWGWSLKRIAGSESSQDSDWVRRGTTIRAACFSPSGKRFVTACNDGQVLVWSFSKVKPDGSEESTTRVAPLLESELQLGSTVFDVKFLSENVLVTGGRDRTARVWDIHSATEIATRTYHEGTVGQVAFAGSDKLLTNTGGVLRIWTSADYEVPLDGGLPERSSPSPLSQQPQLPKDLKKSSLIAWSRSKDLLAVATEEQNEEKKETDPKVHIWTRIPKEGANADHNLLQHAVRLPSRIAAPETTGSERKLKFHQLAFGRHNGQDVLAIVGEEQDGKGKQRGVIYFGIPDTKDTNTKLALYSVTVPDDESPYPHAEAVKCAVFSGSGELLVTGDENDKAKTWKVADLVKKIREAELEGTAEGGKPIQSTQLAELGHSSDVVDLRFAPDTKGSPEMLLATVSSEGEAAVWTVSANAVDADKVATPEAKYKLQHDAKILSVTFSPDGRWIVTGGADSAVRVWNTAEGKLAGIIRHSGSVEYAALLEDDRLVTASRSSVVQDGAQQLALEIRERKLADFSLDSVELKQLAAQEMKEDGQLRRLDVNEYRETALPAMGR